MDFHGCSKLSAARERAAESRNRDRAGPGTMECPARSVPHARKDVNRSRFARVREEHEAFHLRGKRRPACKVGRLSSLLRRAKFRGRVIAVVLGLKFLPDAGRFLEKMPFHRICVATAVMAKTRGAAGPRLRMSCSGDFLVLRVGDDLRGPEDCREEFHRDAAIHDP